MHLVCISDTHNQHKKVTIPECDLLLHAGDFSGSGEIWETKEFLEWFSKQPAKHKIFISGNHDFLDQKNPTLFQSILKEYPDVVYLRDEMVTIEGIRIYGRPWTPEFYNWAFMKPRASKAMNKTLSIIPEGIDILLTHGPAFGILDKNSLNSSVGCEDLLIELDRIKPRYMVFGHIHHSAGIKEVNNTVHINASVLNDRYKMSFLPIEINLENV